MNAVTHNQSREHTHKLASHTPAIVQFWNRGAQFCFALVSQCLQFLFPLSLGMHCSCTVDCKSEDSFFTISYTLYETSLNDQMRTCCEEIHRNIAWMAGLQILCIESIPYSWFILGKLNWQKESDPISHVHETSWKHLGTVDLGNHIGFVGTSSLKFDT